MTTNKKAGPEGPAQKTPVDRLDEQYGPDPWPSAPDSADETPRGVARLPARFDALLGAAQTGDPAAWGWLFALAAHYLRDGKPVPEPLADVIADRLKAVHDAFTDPHVKDKRSPLYDALAPVQSIRVYGPKPKPNLLTEAARDVIRHAGPEPTAKRIKAEIDRVLQLLPRAPGSEEPLYKASSIEKRVRELRNKAG